MHYLPICAATPLIVFLLLLTPFPASALQEHAAHVVQLQGDVRAEDGNRVSRDLTPGSLVHSGETIITGAGQAELQFTDGMILHLYKHTKFAIDDYRLRDENGAGGDHRADFILLQGLIRMVTGSISPERKAKYQIRTTMAVLGIRGTHFSVLFDKILHVSVNQGTVVLSHKTGEHIIDAGQHAHMHHPDHPPKKVLHAVPLDQHRIYQEKIKAFPLPR
ncbi:MAG: FecR domain-containing protein [Gammaproteobacteria bacterium]|nr:FecR domain-containing protein [Gammaproteobacteria bacterium]